MPQNHVIPVRLATTGPISILQGPPLIDGVAPDPGDRILVKQQVKPIENGIYIWHGVGVPMTRALDSPVNAGRRVLLAALSGVRGQAARAGAVVRRARAAEELTTASGAGRVSGAPHRAREAKHGDDEDDPLDAEHHHLGSGVPLGVAELLEKRAVHQATGEAPGCREQEPSARAGA